MRKSWLMCVLLGTLAWGQAAPSAPPAAPGAGPGNTMNMGRPQAPPAPPAPPDTSASVPDTSAVITVIGVCPPPKPAAAKGTAAATKTPAAKTPAADCKTVVTKAEFEKLVAALVPNVTPQAKKQLAGILPNYIAMSAAAKKKGLDKTDQFKLTIEFAKMQILTKELQKSVADEAAKVSPEEIEAYYKEHADAFEQFNLDRMFIPRTKQPSADAKEEAKDDAEKDKNLSEDAKKAKEAADKAKADQAEEEMTKLAESLRARAAAGEDFVKLQKEAFEAAGMKIEAPTVNLPSVRRTGLQAGHAAVFDLKPGEVSQVINDAGGHYIYKLNSKTEMPLDQATNEIRGKLQNDRTRKMMDDLNSSFKVETNDQYFPGGVSAAPPPRVPRPRPGMPPNGGPQGGAVLKGPQGNAPQSDAPASGAPAAQPQTPPSTPPPAAKPN
jgi:chemotaxis protein histidine kinase CheA